MSTTTFTQDELNTNLSDLSMDKGEFVEKLANTIGLVHKDDLADLDASGESELEAYSTGVQGADDELTGSTSPAQQQHVDRFEERQERAQNADPDEYETGITGDSRSGGGQATDRKHELQAVADDCGTVNEFAAEIDVDRSDATNMIALYGISGLEDSADNYSTGISEDNQ